MGSPSPTSATKAKKKKKLPNKKGSETTDNNKTVSSDDEGDSAMVIKGGDERISELENRLTALEEEREKMKGEIWGLRDRLQELEWQNQQLGLKLAERV